MKQCSKCKIGKPTNDFYSRKDVPRKTISCCKKCFNAYCIERWIQRKIDAISLKGGKCVRCGIIATNSNYPIFDFHHRDRGTKEYGWNKLRLKGDKIRMKELEKCDLVCSNCHRLIENELVTQRTE